MRTLAATMAAITTITFAVFVYAFATYVPSSPQPATHVVTP